MSGIARTASGANVILCLLLASCAATRPLRYRVIPAKPDYLLRSPDLSDIPFGSVLHAFNGFETTWGSVSLRPKMTLRVENAYYRDGVPKRGLEGYLGTETAQYEVDPQGSLHLESVRSIKNRPRDQLPVQQLIGHVQRDYPYQRFYFAIGFSRHGNLRSSVLLGASSTGKLDLLADQLLSDPDTLCNKDSSHCTIFPELCSVSVAMDIVVNGVHRNVPWGSLLENIKVNGQHVELLRLYRGRLTPVDLGPIGPNVLLLPLLPGDHVKIN